MLCRSPPSSASGYIDLDAEEANIPYHVTLYAYCLMEHHGKQAASEGKDSRGEIRSGHKEGSRRRKA
ncbi:hypothetical protein BPY_06010 [Bifidobacterium psychraerophilum]